MRTAIVLASFVAAGLLSAAARAEDPASLYDVAFEATGQVAKGAQGRVKVRITPKTGAHVSADAPNKLSLKAPAGLSLAKAKADKSDMKFTGLVAAFDVPFTAVASGSATIDAKLNFYICTDTTCTPQERTASLAVNVQ